MQKIGKFVGQALIIAFAAVIIAYTSALTFVLAARIVPDNMILQAITVILFDGAAFVWFILFISRANSVAQWGIAGLSWILSIMGVAVMAGGELAFSQSLFTVDEPEKLGFILVIAVIAAAIYNATMVYIFHLVDGEVWQSIENRIAVAAAMGEAYKTARAEIESGGNEQIKAITADLITAVTEEARQTIASKASAHRRAAQEAIILDAPVRPANARQYPADTGKALPTNPTKPR